MTTLDAAQVELEMDQLLAPQTTSEALYRRWETQQWAVSDLDFTLDKEHWKSLQPGVQTGVRRTMTLFFIGEQAVTDTLSPILHAAPAEDERIFLATQIADEARHTVFFQRFFAEVLEQSGTLHEALEVARPEAVSGFRKIFDDHLAGCTDLVRREPGNRRAWVEAVVTYHLVIEGYLALTGQRNLLRLFRNVGLMPGFTIGFTAVARDESRHIGFGVMALRRRVAADPAVAGWVAERILELLEPAVHTAVQPDQKLALADPAAISPPLRVDPLEAREFSISSLLKRVRAAGLSESAVAGIDAAMRAHYEAAWSLYESNHGEPHPVRWYQAGNA